MIQYGPRPGAGPKPALQSYVSLAVTVTAPGPPP